MNPVRGSTSSLCNQEEVTPIESSRARQFPTNHSHSECYRRTTTRTTKSLDTGLSISVLRRALDGVDDEYIDGAALRVELQSELFLQRRID